MKKSQHIINILNYLLIIGIELIILYLLKKNDYSVDNIKIIFAIINLIIIIGYNIFKINKKESNVNLIILSIIILLITTPLLWIDKLSNEYKITRMRPKSKCSQVYKCDDDTDNDGEVTCYYCEDLECTKEKTTTCEITK